MSRSPDQYYSSPTPKDFAQYVNRDANPPLKLEQLDMSLLRGTERQDIGIDTTGDFSLLLRYKNKPGYVSSFVENDDELTIVQLQGGREGYRVMTGLRVVQLFCDQIQEIALHPESPYTTLAIPYLMAIKGIADAAETAMKRYEEAIDRLGLTTTEDNQKLLKRLR